MANNPYVNKVELADGTMLIDLSGDTLATAGQLVSGVTAHARDGSSLTGTAIVPTVTQDGTTGVLSIS